MWLIKFWYIFSKANKHVEIDIDDKYCARLNKILNFHVCSQIFHIFVAENIPSINYALIGEMDPLAWFLFLLTKKKPPPPKKEGRTEKKNETKEN